MSSIPNAAMPHAKSEVEETEATLTERAKSTAKKVGTKAESAADKATKLVKDNPKTAAAVGVAVLAAGAAAIAAPMMMGKDKPSAKPKTTRKTPAKKAPAKN